jgi:hypothetical protein
MMIPARIPLGTEKHGTLIVVDAVNLPAFCGKEKADFRSNQTRRTGYKDFPHRSLLAAIILYDFVNRGLRAAVRSRKRHQIPKTEPKA